MEIPKIQVIIRKRPLNEREVNSRQTDIVNITKVCFEIFRMKLDLTKYIDEHTFSFDGVIDQHVQNGEMYQDYIRPILSHAFAGNKGTVFAFGQTGSGKTYTMNGYPKKGVSGLYQYAAYDIFQSIKHPNLIGYSVTCTFHQLYCGRIYDLLNQRTELRLLEDKKKDMQITGGTKIQLKSAQDLMKAIKSGMSLRITSKNGTNNESSRSHAILNIQIGQGKKYGQISFIDLAGCERGADTIDQNKQTKVDGAQINKSLLALKECIRAMDANKKHIPFRGNKLTLLLRESFGDSCKTLMIGNISPGNNSCENTLNTLRYSDTVKQLKSTKQKSSKEDLKSRELMLTRNQKNTVSVLQIEQDESQDFISRYNTIQNVSKGSTKTSKRLPTQQNNLNFKNIQNIMDKRPSMSTTRSKGDIKSPVPKKNMMTQNNNTDSLSPVQYQDWQSSIQLIKSWDINTQPYTSFEQLTGITKNYLQRELQQYFFICQLSIEQEQHLNQQKMQMLRNMYNNSNQSNEQLYQKSLVLSRINQDRSNLLNKQQTKLRDYMSHLQLQQQCQRKAKQAYQLQSSRMKNDDEISMIDEIQSEWGDQLNSYDYPQTVHRPITRQSLNIQKDNNYNFAMVKSYEYRPF